MQQRLLEANLQQTDPPLAEVESLLATLAEAWRSIQAAAGPAPTALEASIPSDYQPVSCSY